MNNEKTVTVQTDATPTQSFNDRHGIMSGKDCLLGVRRFWAKNAGLPASAIEKKSTKEVKAILLSRGIKAETLKTQEATYNGAKAEYHAASAEFLGAIAANPAWRKSAKRSFNAKGQVIGYSATMRRERTAKTSVTLATQLAQANKELLALRAQLAVALPAPAQS